MSKGPRGHREDGPPPSPLESRLPSSIAAKTTINPPVFITAAVALIFFLIFGTFFAETAQTVFPKMLDAVADRFGWFYLGISSLFIVICLALAASPLGKVRLGPDDARPRFTTLSWFSMLFSAGMGIGLLFYGVAEPVMHYQNPPAGPGSTAASADAALPITFFHWGLHAWAIYVMMGLAIAYFAYRKGLPLALRSCFVPLLKGRVDGWAGHLIDLLAVFGTLFGLATSLGLGASQINAGLHHLFDVPLGRVVQLIIIATITGAATVSLVTGVEKGIRRLSELNLLLAGLLMLFVFFVGPTAHLVSSFFSNLGGYVGSFVDRSFPEGAFSPDSWLKSWTIFYWGWWIAWAPFVGMFVARISRGRTVREFILGVLLVPTAVTFLWLTVFGDTALFLEMAEGGIAQAVSENVSTSIYVMLDKLPLAAITSMLAAAVVAVFFVTSSDSASFVVDMLTSGGHPDPPRWQRVFWAVAEGSVAAVLLVASGREALSALQSAVICVAAPFSVILVAMCGSLLLSLLRDRQAEVPPDAEQSEAEGPGGPDAEAA